jgi:FAD/FMN-containing dehydrogenase
MFRGPVLGPGDAGYDEARTITYGGFDIHPAAIVQVADVDDVRRGIELARELPARLAIKGGGHSVAGHSLVEGGLVLDVSPLKSITIDADARTAVAETGLTALEFSSAAEELGLVVGFGDTGSVGIGGITLGGGVGYLVRKHGLTIDSLLGATIVTADGEMLQVDAEHHPDLFWAIRGGGGNFGVVTRFDFRLEPVEDVVGGMIMLPATVETIAGFIELLETASDNLSGIANVMPAPPMPGVPEESLGTLVVFGLLVHAGDRHAGEQAMDRVRSLATPMVDMLRPMAYTGIYPPEEPDYHPTAAGDTMFMDRVDRDVARTILDYLEGSDASMRVAQLRVLGGAMARVPADATAFAHRSSRIMTNVAAFHDDTDEDRARKMGWVREFAGALQQGDRGAYVNFLADEGEERVRDAYPGRTWDRLRDVKRRYDPTNLFNRNQNIPPAS